jgi:hypothetical protein
LGFAKGHQTVATLSATKDVSTLSTRHFFSWCLISKYNFELVTFQELLADVALFGFWR